MATNYTGVFTDLALAQDSTYLKDPNGFLNEASTRTLVLGMGIKGSSGRGIKTLQGGSEIKEQYFAEYQDTVVDWHPEDDDFDLPNPQVLREHGIGWSRMATPLSWSDVEVEQQADTTSDGMYRKLTDLLARKRQHSQGNQMEQMDVRMLLAPDYDTQAGVGARKPYSLPSIITENDNGGVPLGWTGTELQGVDTANPYWKNQISTYAHAEGATTATGQSLFEAFDDMMLKAEFKQYPQMAEATPSSYGPSTNLLCSRWGKRLFMSALRNSNDSLVSASRQDPAYLKPMYAGVPVEHVERLGTGEYYDDGSSGREAEAAADIAGPRFYFWNAEFLCPIFHSSRYFKSIPTAVASRNPFRHSVWYDTWWNLFCRSKRRQGIISPSVDITASTGVAA